MPERVQERVQELVMALAKWRSTDSATVGTPPVAVPIP